jgi:D-alanine-D-alanine ligase
LKKIAVIAGGWSGERPISLISGESVIAELRKARKPCVAYDLLPDSPLRVKPLGTPAWARRVRLADLVKRLRRDKVGVCLICLHGPGGEDGRIQGLLDLAGIAYTGSGVRASAMAMHKHTAKQLFRDRGIPTADWAFVPKGAQAPAFKLPLVVKPCEQGSALGVSVVRKKSELKKALAGAWRWGGEALIERYIKGRELTVAVLGKRALPVVEILPQKGEFYDFASKYDEGGSRHLCPAPISAALTRRAQKLGLEAHQALGCKGYSRTDLMLDAKGGLWVLETNSLPGMTPVSLLPDAARAAGYSYLKLLMEMVKQA